MAATNTPGVLTEDTTDLTTALLPHMGSATIKARIAMGEKILINIRAFADGHRSLDRVIQG